VQCCTPSCSCPNGIEATGAACTSHNANICTSCEADYFLDGQSCSKIQVCTTIDGSIENSNDCACGTSVCTVDTGRKCVASFDFCSTSGFVPGNVTLSGSTLLPQFMGKYEWLGSNLNGKPTYKYTTKFLYWYPEQNNWHIGETLGSQYRNIYWSEDVLRPELSPKPTAIRTYSYFNNKWNLEILTIISSKACVVATGLSTNNDECTCGSSDCDSSTGFFCVAANNKCSTRAICNVIDGSTENSIDCACGTTDCTESTGRFCFAYGNECSTNAIQVCTTTDGSEANLNDCTCGTTECTAATGRKCVASLNVCTSGFVPGDVTLSGSILLPGVMGKYEWSGSNLNGKPTYKYHTHFLYWHSGDKRWLIGPTLGADGRFIYWYDDVLRPDLSPKPTTIKAWANSKWTVETLTITSSKACVVATGLSINDGECTCGTTDCDVSTGFFCVASSNACSTRAICNVIDGSTGNSIDCACGTNDCTVATGRFCFAYGNKCSTNAIQVCTTTDGSEANLDDCTCGTTECTAATGRKCVASLNACTSGFVPGDVTLSGSILLSGVMGKYEWSGSNLNGKPTYKYHTHFLYWHSGDNKWYIGNILGTIVYVSWTEDVLRPELSPKPTTINAWANSKWNEETLTITSSKACVVANGESINDGECTCGTTDCDSSTGFFCVTLLDSCTPTYFVPGDLTLTLSGSTTDHSDKMGTYRWDEPFYRNGKPVYKKLGTETNYLYFVPASSWRYPARWVLGPTPGSVSCYFYWIEDVTRPELSLFDTDQSKVKVSNRGTPSSYMSQCSNCWNDATISIASSKSCPVSSNGLSANVNQCTCVSSSLSV